MILNLSRNRAKRFPTTAAWIHCANMFDSGTCRQHDNAYAKLREQTKRVNDSLIGTEYLYAATF